MKKIIKHYITINNKKYFYSIKQINKKVSLFHCEEAKILQEFLNDDLPGLLNDLPELIIAEHQYNSQQEQIIRFRISAEDKKIIQKNALKKGYSTVSSFLRDLGLGRA